MKIIGIAGSARVNGNSATLMKAALKGAAHSPRMRLHRN